MLDSNENIQQNAETGHRAKYVVRLEEYGGKNPLFHCFWNGKNFDLKELSEAKKFDTWNEIYFEMNRFGYELGREYTILEIKEDVPEEERSTGPKLFISQPMKGKTDEEIMTERSRIIDEARKLYGDVKIIDSFFAGQDTSNPVRCLSRSLERLACADIVWFAPGWNETNGCTIEHEVAKRYLGDKIIIEEKSK